MTPELPGSDAFSRTCVIFNPVAKGDKARRFRGALGDLAGGCVFKPTTGPGAARGLAREAVEEGFEVVVAAGGDGTVNEVVNGIGDAEGGFERVALGVIPLGTANVFARELKIPLRVRSAWAVLRRGQVRRVDVVRAEYGVSGGRESRLFIQVAGAGLDARAVELVDWGLKKRAGFLAYVVAGVKALGERHPELVVTGDGREQRGELVLFGNGACYGGPFRLIPSAGLSDGKVGYRIFPRASWGTALRVVGRLVTGRFSGVAGSVEGGARVVEVRSEGRVPVELDGDVVGALPLRLEVMRGAVRVVA
jgi:diacylglycerol kinase (ATP)